MRRRPHDRLRPHRLGREPGLEHILRQRNHDRPRQPRGRDLKRPQHGLGSAGGIRDLRDPLRDAAEHAPVVDLLEGTPPQILRRDLADQQDERHRILLRGMHRDRGVRRAGAAADAGDARAPGQARIGERHQSRARLVAAHHQVDAGAPVQRVEEPEIALARDAEDAVEAMRGKALDDQFTDARHEGSRGALRSPLVRLRLRKQAFGHLRSSRPERRRRAEPGPKPRPASCRGPRGLRRITACCGAPGMTIHRCRS